MKKKHVCPNHFNGEGARGGCYVSIYGTDREGVANLAVGWSCVTVHHGDIPVSWIAEIVAVASGHEGGIAGFLDEHNYGGGYALQCDPAPPAKRKYRCKNSHE